jgi:type I restriction enzyme R subunit
LPIEYRDKNDTITTDNIKLIDFQNPENNNFKAINQFAIVENNHSRRPDIVIFINGLPLIIFELKNPSDENATIDSAYLQLQTYKNEIPGIFNYNELLVISDGVYTQVGTLTSPREWFLPWKTIDGENLGRNVFDYAKKIVIGGWHPLFVWF